MFQEEYRKAYDNINPDRDSIDRILKKAAAESIARAERTSAERISAEGVAKEWLLRAKATWPGRLGRAVRPIAVGMLMLCLFSALTLTVAAQQIPAVYRVIEAYAPSLAEFMLPEEISSTSQGITMQVEAIDMVDNTAEVLISFRDAEDSERDIIKGKIDLCDSVRLQNYGEEWAAGGVSFLEYDEAEDKAYYKVELTSSDVYSKNLVRLGVTQILTRLAVEEKEIPMENLLSDPAEKVVSLSGSGGRLEKSAFPFYKAAGYVDASGPSDALYTDEYSEVLRPENPRPEDPRPGCRVMDIVELDESLMEDLVITGVAYDEGVLRVQSCRGNFANADRHVRIYLKDAAGEERICDGSVGWQEEIDGQRILFDEAWFLISQEELENYDLYGMFYVSDGCIKGNWEVTFRLN